MRKLIRCIRYRIVPHYKMFIPEFVKDVFVNRYIQNGGLKKKIWGDCIFEEAISRNIEIFLSPKESGCCCIRQNYVYDMVKAYVFYGVVPDEYFMFQFNVLSKQKKREILSVKTKDLLCFSKPSAFEAWNQLEDKYAFYKMMGTFFKRDVLKIDADSTYESFSLFCDNHKSFILKPLSGQCGQGVSIYKEVNGDLETLFCKLKSISGGVVLEELIKQAKEMSAWNASSVNSVRIPSIATQSGLHILQPFFRTGRKGAYVDNTGAGGVFAAIDEKDGTVITDGYDESGNRYEKHPDSHIQYHGWKIPKWDELLDLVGEVHRSLSSIHHYVGFDFALTDDGWVLIEGNWGQFTGQYCTHRGVRKEFYKLMR